MQPTETKITAHQRRHHALQEAREIAHSRFYLDKAYPLKYARYSDDELNDIEDKVTTFIELFPDLLSASLKTSVYLTASMIKNQKSEEEGLPHFVKRAESLDHLNDRELINTYLRLGTLLDLVENLQEVHKKKRADLKKMLLQTLAQAMLTDGILV